MTAFFYTGDLIKIRFWVGFIAAIFNTIFATLILIKYCQIRKELNKPTTVVL